MCKMDWKTRITWYFQKKIEYWLKSNIIYWFTRTEFKYDVIQLFCFRQNHIKQQKIIFFFLRNYKHIYFLRHVPLFNIYLNVIVYTNYRKTQIYYVQIFLSFLNLCRLFGIVVWSLIDYLIGFNLMTFIANKLLIFKTTLFYFKSYFKAVFVKL